MKKYYSLLAIFAVLCLSSCQTNQNKWIDLLNGKDLTGWKTTDQPDRFRMEDSVLICSGAPGIILSEKAGEFRNFELVAEMKTSPKSFAEILFHTSAQHQDSLPSGYQVVIGNSPRQMDEKKMAMRTGSLLGVRNIYFPMVADGEWFSLTVKVVENHVETFVKGIRVMDYYQPVHPWRSEKNAGRILNKGFFGIETLAGVTFIKSLKVRTLPRSKKEVPPVSDDWDAKVTKLMEQNFPLIDFHVHLKGGLTIDQAIANSQKLGINYGVAPNCGLRFPIKNDTALAAYMDTVRNKPIFRGMQAEGREWITLFSPQAVAKFDYVFSDAMTFTDTKGRRNRIWIPEEVWVDDKQQFMDQLVAKIEDICSQEPVDIYVNPTMLPVKLMPEYDQLWTPERIRRVIEVLKVNHIALEINSRYKIPHVSIIREAKKAGVKFTFGTNNPAADLGQLDYCFQMIDECGLTPEDMFMPKEQTQKPVLLKGLPAKITG